MGVRDEPNAADTWGWRGRTLGRPVRADRTAAWLRLASDPTDYDTFWWDGPAAANHLPAALPRPHLHATIDWTNDTWRYRAELYDRAPPAISDSPVLATDLDLPGTWWRDLHRALAALAAVPTTRMAVRQTYLDHAMPARLGTPIDTTSPAAWTTCHGDLHFANLCAPRLAILDWEGWGRAPAGYDAARLHCAALLRPTFAARVRAEFAPTLETPAGRYAELVVITELLDTARCGPGTELVQPLRERAESLLGRPIPG